MFKKILLPTDGSEHALKAAKIALKFAREQNAQVEILSVITMPERTVYLLELIPNFNGIKFKPHLFNFEWFIFSSLLSFSHNIGERTFS